MTAIQRSYPWRELVVLGVAGTVSLLSVGPYGVALSRQAPHPEPLPPITAGFLLSFLLSKGAQIFVSVGLGLLLARRVLLGAPYLQRRLYGTPAPRPFRSVLGPAVLLGVVPVLADIVLDRFVFMRVLGLTAPAPEIHSRLPPIAAWKGFLTAGAGITEELIFRLFLFSLFAWLIGVRFRGAPSRPGDGVLWAANVASSLLFGLAHLEGIGMFSTVTPLLLTRTLVFIFLPGLAFGWLYGTFGLEAAMIAHAIADIVVHGIRPLFQ